MDINASINATREKFEESFSSGDFYCDSLDYRNSLKNSMKEKSYERKAF